MCIISLWFNINNLIIVLLCFIIIFINFVMHMCLQMQVNAHRCGAAHAVGEGMNEGQRTNLDVVLQLLLTLGCSYKALSGLELTNQVDSCPGSSSDPSVSIPSAEIASTCHHKYLDFYVCVLGFKARTCACQGSDLQTKPFPQPLLTFKMCFQGLKRTLDPFVEDLGSVSNTYIGWFITTFSS